MAEVAAEAGDDGTNDVIVSDVVRRSEWQVWFVAGHRADTQHSYRQCRCRCRGRVDRPARLIEPGARASSEGLSAGTRHRPADAVPAQPPDACRGRFFSLCSERDLKPARGLASLSARPFSADGGDRVDGRVSQRDGLLDRLCHRPARLWAHRGYQASGTSVARCQPATSRRFEPSAPRSNPTGSR